MIRLRNFIKTVNKDNQFLIVFPFFTIKNTGENGEWIRFGFCQDWRNQHRILPYHSGKNILETAEATVHSYSSKYLFLKIL